MYCEGQILYRWTHCECILSIPYLHAVVECMYETHAFSAQETHIYMQLYYTNPPHHVQIELHANTRWIIISLKLAGLSFDASRRERERETYRLLGVAPPTFHLGYGPAIDLVGELLVVVTETTGVDLPTAG